MRQQGQWEKKQPFIATVSAVASVLEILLLASYVLPYLRMYKTVTMKRALCLNSWWVEGSGPASYLSASKTHFSVLYFSSEMRRGYPSSQLPPPPDSHLCLYSASPFVTQEACIIDSFLFCFLFFTIFTNNSIFTHNVSSSFVLKQINLMKLFWVWILRLSPSEDLAAFCFIAWNQIDYIFQTFLTDVGKVLPK